MLVTEYLRSAIGHHVLDNDAMTSPTDVYLALFTTAPTVEGGGTEVDGGSYARQSVSFLETSMPGEFENVSVSFADMPEATVVAIGVYDDETAGELLYFEEFSPVSVNEDDTYPVNAGVFTIRHV